MKRVVTLISLLAVCAGCAHAQQAAQITSIREARSLSNAEARKHQSVDFQATVTYYRAYESNLFVQDGDTAIFVLPKIRYKLVPGDLVRVRGKMRESFQPLVIGAEITVLGHGSVPKPTHATYDQMIRAETDCKIVTVHAVIRSADLTPNHLSTVPTTEIHMLVDGGNIDASIDGDDPSRLKDLLDAEVEVTGVQSGQFDNKMQQTGVLLHVQSLDQVKILKSSHVDPWSIKPMSMDQILTGYHIQDQSIRQHIHGTITYYQPGSALVLQDGTKSLWIATNSWSPLQVGSVADVIGFPDIANGFLTMNRGEIRQSPVRSPVTPSLLTWKELAVGGNDGHSHAFDLVSIEGQVVTEVREATQDEFVIASDGHLFSAILRHPNSASRISLTQMKEVPPGSRVRITGICLMSDPNPFNGEVPFNLLIRDFDDIVVISQPPWLNVAHLLMIVVLLFFVVVAIGVRGWVVERRVRQKTAGLAYLEQRRSRILEDINSARPLSDTLERITEIVSFKLHGAACWCEIEADARLVVRTNSETEEPDQQTQTSSEGAEIPGRLGRKRPDKITTQRIIQQKIPGRNGVSMGTLYAAIHPMTKPSPLEDEALSLGAGLAALAIETSHLYSDLVHRSEFDLLTDMPNRFSLDKHLQESITEARQSGRTFGFIYIDLDQFKQVNDQYGHQVGDMYLQEAAQRMKRQLRPGDILARMGGDEFAVVVSPVHSRHEVEEIATRLERCFDDPFALESHLLHGSASVGIAIFPEDATSADGLLNKADAAMYSLKQSRQTCRSKRSYSAAAGVAPSHSA